MSLSSQKRPDRPTVRTRAVSESSVATTATINCFDDGATDIEDEGGNGDSVPHVHGSGSMHNLDDDSWMAYEVEPGVDVRKSDFGDIWARTDLNITLVDWSSERARIATDLDNSHFLRLLAQDRPEWSNARWISLNDGLSWDVFKALALKYDLHPLAVEDCLHIFDRSAQTKCDWFSRHLFVRLIFWQLSPRGPAAADSSDDSGDESLSDPEPLLSPRPSSSSRNGTTGRQANGTTASKAAANQGPQKAAEQRRQHRTFQERLRNRNAQPIQQDQKQRLPRDPANQPVPLSSSPEPVRSVDFTSSPSVTFAEPAQGHERPSQARSNASMDARRPMSKRSMSLSQAVPGLRVSRTTGRATVRPVQARRGSRSETEKGSSSTFGPGPRRSDSIFDKAKLYFGASGSRTRASDPEGMDYGPASRGVTTEDLEEDPFSDDRHRSKWSKAKHGELVDILEAESDADDPEETMEAKSYAARRVIKRLTREYRVLIERQQLSIFLTKDGTLISIFSKDGNSVIPSIIARLRIRDTLLRNSADPSMLLQALLDVCVDKNLEIIDSFRKKLDLLEGTALVNPSLGTVRHLHVLSQQLATVRRTIMPVQNLLMTLRTSDQQRSAIAMPSMSSNSSHTGLKMNRVDSASHLGVPGSRAASGHDHPSATSATHLADPGSGFPSGFISPMAKVYLNDVLDHVDSAISSLELFMGMSQQLEDYIFNTLSFSSNETMKQLTYITIIFLPLSFLTGYFGMNFAIFPEALEGNVTYFWKIAAPVSFAIITILALPDLMRLGRVMRRRLLHGRYVKKSRQRRSRKSV